jgi:hypothetical protein
MKKILATFLALLVALPASVAALRVETNATARSGGVGAANGESVVTGSNRSSAQIVNYMTGGNGGGTTTIDIIRTVNGVTETEQSTYVTGPNPVQIEARAGTDGTNGASVRSLRDRSEIKPVFQQKKKEKSEVRANSYTKVHAPKAVQTHVQNNATSAGAKSIVQATVSGGRSNSAAQTGAAVFLTALAASSNGLPGATSSPVWFDIMPQVLVSLFTRLFAWL